MSRKPEYVGDFAEESYSSDDDELEISETTDRHRPRGRPPKNGCGQYPSVNMSSSRNTCNSNNESSSAPRRRGRGPSKRPCQNRNALMARENRQRKKAYIEKIETRLQNVQKENHELNATIQRQSVEIKRLSDEVQYLKNILQNNTQITTLMRAVNESLRKMHGQSEEAGESKQSTDVLNWFKREETNKSNNTSMPILGITDKVRKDDPKEDISTENICNRLKYETNQTKIARKTMPLKMPPSGNPPSENPPSNESYFEEQMPMKFSPFSGSCEYNTDKSSAGLARTPMSTLSNSMDKCEVSLSDPDFSQLSSIDDIFDNIGEMECADNPFQFEQDTSALFHDDALFYLMDKDSDLVKSPAFHPLDSSKTSNNDRIFTSSENAGVCLHINSNRVSLEYCSKCHMNSLNNLNSQFEA